MIAWCKSRSMLNPMSEDEEQMYFFLGGKSCSISLAAAGPSEKSISEKPNLLSAMSLVVTRSFSSVGVTPTCP
eukprot:4263959-Amphidinium_carterae.1